ncbi:MAG: hypothetical protein HQM08_23865 [Candidatus Riflebacteria bacterium]|nr:hypothetical protein [Candidatus Riflebacteria bacterium]
MTLVELIIAIICAMILLPSIWNALSSGTRSSLRGMAQVHTTTETKVILELICDDLYNSCIEYGSSPVFLDVNTAILNNSGGPPYTFFAFPRHGNLYDAMISPKTGGSPRILTSPVQNGGADQPDQTGRAERLVSEITYDLEPLTPNQKLLNKLIRKEKFHPLYPLASKFSNGVKIDVLSEHVQNFSIRREIFYSVPNSNKERVLLSFRISIQLVEVTPGTNVPDKLVDPLRAPPGIVVSDYFDIVCPKFFNERFNNGCFNHNWQSGAVNSPDKAGD